MATDFDYFGYKDKLFKEAKHPYEHYTFKFANDYGASVLRFTPKQLWELAVLWFDGNDGYLEFGTHIAHDVIYCLTDDEVSALLKEISELDLDGRRKKNGTT